MGRMGLLPRPELLAAVLRHVALRLRRHVLLLTAGWAPLLHACGRQPRLPFGVLALEHPVAHDVLLPHCSVLLHHGGAGTVAAALRCGTPQLLCPLHFDQQQWAERVAYLGCGSELSPAALLQAGDVAPEPAQLQQQVEAAAAAVTAALASLADPGSGAGEQCVAMQRQLAGEDGLAAAAAHIEQRAAAGSAAVQAAQAAEGGQAGTGGAAQAADAQHAPPAETHDLLLPDGLRVQCISVPEAMYIHREIFVDDCYGLDQGLPPGSTVVDAGARGGARRGARPGRRGRAGGCAAAGAHRRAHRRAQVPTSACSFLDC